MTTKNEIRSSFGAGEEVCDFCRSVTVSGERPYPVRFDKGLDTAVSLGSYARPPPRFACDVRRTISA